MIEPKLVIRLTPADAERVLNAARWGASCMEEQATGPATRAEARTCHETVDRLSAEVDRAKQPLMVNL